MDSKCDQLGSILTNPPPILDFDPCDRIGFEIWQKKWKSWIFLANITDATSIYHFLVKAFTNKTMQVLISI